MPSSFASYAEDEGEEDLAQVFDRAWARAVMRQAAETQARWATDDAKQRRVELLRLRFQEGKPIRDIAAAWGTDPARLHTQFSQARTEFSRALREVVAFHLPGRPDDVEHECRTLLELLQ